MKRTLSIAILIALAFGMFMVGSGFSSHASTGQQWEYKIEYKMNEKKANELGSQGWELVAIGGTGSGVLSNVQDYVFKRAK